MDKEDKKYIEDGLLGCDIKEESLVESKEDILSVVEREIGVSDRPIDGPSYIMPNGKFLTIWRSKIPVSKYSATGSATHRDVQQFLYSKGLVKDDFWSCDDPDLEKLGCIRVNSGFEEYIWLPDNRPNETQWNSLLIWLDWYFRFHHKLMVGFKHYAPKTYSDSDYTTDEILKKCKEAYGRGYLTEKIAKEDYQKKFDERTHAHIDRVNKYAKKINKEYPHHDEDKFNELYDGYSLMSKENVSDEEQKLIDDATFRHVRDNEHHCEHWVDEKDIEGFSRNNPTPHGCLDCSKMPNDALEEMCCDWCAMSEEFNNTPFEWYEKNKDTRWHFNEEQDKFILDTLHKLWDKSIDEDLQDNVLDALDKEFGQEELYMWSTYILPNGHFLNPDNGNLKNIQYENCDFEDWAYQNGYNTQDIFDNCLKMNVTYPYLSMPDKERPTQEQLNAIRKILDRKDLFEPEGSFYWYDIFPEEKVDSKGENLLAVYTPKGDELFDLDVSDADDIIRAINQAYVRGGFFGESVSKLDEDSGRDTFIFKGKKAWSGAVNTLDGTIEETHSYSQAKQVGFHHSFYFSDSQLDKMDEGDSCFFCVYKDHTIMLNATNRFNSRGDDIELREDYLKRRIKEQIKFIDEESLQEKIVKKGSKWQVQSEKGRNLGTYNTKKEAEDRLKQVHYFKHMNSNF